MMREISSGYYGGTKQGPLLLGCGGGDEAPSRQTWSLAPESNSKAGVRAGAGEGCCSGSVMALFDFVGWERWERG